MRANLNVLRGMVEQMRRNLPSHVVNATNVILYDMQHDISKNGAWGVQTPKRRGVDGNYFNDPIGGGTEGGYMNILKDLSMIGPAVYSNGHVIGGFINKAILNKRTQTRANYWWSIHETNKGVKANPYLRFIPAKYLKGYKGRSGEGIMVDIRKLKKKKAWHGEMSRGTEYSDGRPNKPQKINAERFKKGYPGVKPVMLLNALSTMYLYKLDQGKAMMRYMGLSDVSFRVAEKTKRMGKLQAELSRRNAQIMNSFFDTASNDKMRVIQDKFNRLSRAMEKLAINLARDRALLDGYRGTSPGPVNFQKPHYDSVRYVSPI